MVSTVPWMARQGDLKQSSPADTEEQPSPEAIDFATAHKEIVQRGHQASQPLSSTLLGHPGRYGQRQPRIANSEINCRSSGSHDVVCHCNRLPATVR